MNFDLVSFFFYLYLWIDYSTDESSVKNIKLTLAILSTPTVLYNLSILIRLRSWFLRYILSNTVDFILPGLREYLYYKYYGLFLIDADERWYKDLLIKIISCDHGGMNIYNKCELLYYISNFEKLNNRYSLICKNIKFDSFNCDPNYDLDFLYTYSTEKIEIHDIIDDNDEQMVRIHKNWHTNSISNYYSVERIDPNDDIRFYGIGVLSDDKEYIINFINNITEKDLQTSLNYKIYKTDKCVCSLSFYRYCIG
jgi:hypothetical protein